MDSLDHLYYPLNILSRDKETRRLEMSVIGMKDNDGNFSGVIASFRDISDLGANDYPVCITGETGTGKELVANAIHNESRRGGGPFVPVNCAALPEGILESELFGHVKGAFTGAVRDKKGRFELAHGGTLFMDEVTDLSRVVQAKLLRVLQEKRFEPVGSEKTTIVDIRLICATNRDLKHEMERGNFREDHHENWIRKASEPLSLRVGG